MDRGKILQIVGMVEDVEDAIIKALHDSGYHFGPGEGSTVAARVAINWANNWLASKQVEQRPSHPAIPSYVKRTITKALRIMGSVYDVEEIKGTVPAETVACLRLDIASVSEWLERMEQGK